MTVIVYCLVAVSEPSVAVTVKVDVEFELTAFAVPEKVPLEFNVTPLGSEPLVTESVGVLSSSENEIAVKFDVALPLSAKVPKEPDEVENTGVSLIANAFSNVVSKLERFVILIS